MQNNVFILVMHFRVSEIEPKYYADGEDAYAMRRNLGEFREKVRASIFFYLHFFYIKTLQIC